MSKGGGAHTTAAQGLETPCSLSINHNALMSIAAKGKAAIAGAHGMPAWIRDWCRCCSLASRIGK